MSDSLGALLGIALVVGFCFLTMVAGLVLVVLAQRRSRLEQAALAIRFEPLSRLLGGAPPAWTPRGAEFPGQYRGRSVLVSLALPNRRFGTPAGLRASTELPGHAPARIVEGEAPDGFAVQRDGSRLVVLDRRATLEPEAPRLSAMLDLLVEQAERAEAG